MPEVTSFDSVTGFGVTAQAGGQRVEVGADRYIVKLGLDVTPFTDAAARMGDQGKTPLYAAIDGKLAAILAVADPIKDTTPQAIKALHALGLKVAMITGDNARTANAIARQLGIDEVVAEVLPDGKVAAVKRLKALGPLAYVGDGINDAPALARADIGFAMGAAGTHTAMEAADVVVMNDDLRRLPETIRLSKRTHVILWQNITLALGIKAVFLLMAIFDDASMWIDRKSVV